MLVTTTLEYPVVVFTDTRWLITRVLGEIEVVEVKFKDTTSAEWVLDTGTLTWGGDNPLDNISRVGV